MGDTIALEEVVLQVGHRARRVGRLQHVDDLLVAAVPSPPRPRRAGRRRAASRRQASARRRPGGLEGERVGRAVEEEADALGQEAQVGGLAVDEKVEEQLVQLRCAHPVLLLLDRQELERAEEGPRAVLRERAVLHVRLGAVRRPWRRRAPRARGRRGAASGRSCAAGGGGATHGVVERLGELVVALPVHQVEEHLAHVVDLVVEVRRHDFPWWNRSCWKPKRLASCAPIG